jgi:hypothetical protein
MGGVFAPHANLRARVVACAGQLVAEFAPLTVSGANSALPSPTRRRARGPPERETERVGMPEFSFDQTPPMYVWMA